MEITRSHNLILPPRIPRCHQARKSKKKGGNFTCVWHIAPQEGRPAKSATQPAPVNMRGRDSHLLSATVTQTKGLVQIITPHTRSAQISTKKLTRKLLPNRIATQPPPPGEGIRAIINNLSREKTQEMSPNVTYVKYPMKTSLKPKS